MEMIEQSGITLIQWIVNLVNIEIPKKKAQQNKGASGIDGMTVKELDAHFEEYFLTLRKSYSMVPTNHNRFSE